MAIPSSWTCRWRRCVRRPTYAERRKHGGQAASMEQRPGKHRRASAGASSSRAHARWAPAPASRPRGGLHHGHGADEQQVDSSRQVIGDTVHIDIIDTSGNMFTATPSGGWLHSSPVIPGAGLAARPSRGQMFLAGEGLPAARFRPRQAAPLHPFRRHGAGAMAKLYMTLGHARGDQQDQSGELQLFLRHASFQAPG